jgi:hypothetical protein
VNQQTWNQRRNPDLQTEQQHLICIADKGVLAELDMAKNCQRSGLSCLFEPLPEKCVAYPGTGKPRNPR